MTWIKNVKQWYKMWSVWAFVLLGAYQWLEANSTTLQALLPEKYQGVLGLLLAAGGVLSRLVVQPKLAADGGVTVKG